MKKRNAILGKSKCVNFFQNFLYTFCCLPFYLHTRDKKTLEKRKSLIVSSSKNTKIDFYRFNRSFCFDILDSHYSWLLYNILNFRKSFLVTLIDKNFYILKVYSYLLHSNYNITAAARKFFSWNDFLHQNVVSR